MIALRFIHVGLGVFWAGAMLFVAIFLEPSIRKAGPAGGAVMQQLQAARFATIMPVVALLTMASGFWMYFRLGGSDPAFMASPTGMVLGAGGVLALVAFVFGMAFTRPAVVRLGEPAPQLAQAQPAEREALTAEMERLRGRLRAGGRAVALLLALTVVAMAVARYLH